MKAAMKLFSLALLGLFGCSGKDASADGNASVRIDGSSTVYPISEAMAEEYRVVAPRTRVTVAVSGTGGGFEKFIRGELDINDASRPIKASEAESLAKAGIDYIELPVAFDGIAVTVHKQNSFVDEITVEQLRQIFQNEDVEKWSDVDASWPAEPIKLFGAGTDSGTFDYFTKVVNGKEGRCRGDVSMSESDHDLVNGVAEEKYSLGFFGYAYYHNNQDKLKALKIKTDKGTVGPSPKTIEDGTYAPLSRPLFIYVRKGALESPATTKFVEFYLDNASKLATDVHYVGLPESVQRLTRSRFDARTTGTMYGEGKTGGLVERLQSGS